MPILQTAKFIAKKYGITRESQDAYALTSQQRMAQAQDAGLFDEEIVPITTTMLVHDKGQEKQTGTSRMQTIALSRDEGNRPEEMYLGPIVAIPKLLKRHCLKIDDIDLWELNEAFACQALYRRDALEIDPQSAATSTAARLS